MTRGAIKTNGLLGALSLAFSWLFCVHNTALANADDLVSFKSYSYPSGGWFGSGAIQLLVFDESSIRLQVVDAGAPMPEGEAQEVPGLQQAVAKVGGLGGVNGGFFAREGYPLGLVVIDGVELSALELQSSLLTGVYFENVEGLTLLRSQTYARHQSKFSELKYALQTGPFLVDNYRAVAGLSDDKKRRRSFIARDGKGKWAVGVSDPLTLRRLANLLSDPKNLGGFNVQAALNLDGGTSSSLVWQGVYKMRNSKPVRNYLVLVPKERP